MPFNILLKPNSCQMNDLQYNNFYKPVEKVALYKKGGFFFPATPSHKNILNPG